MDNSKSAHLTDRLGTRHRRKLVPAIRKRSKTAAWPSIRPLNGLADRLLAMRRTSLHLDWSLPTAAPPGHLTASRWPAALAGLGRGIQDVCIHVYTALAAITPPPEPPFPSLPKIEEQIEAAGVRVARISTLSRPLCPLDRVYRRDRTKRPYRVASPSDRLRFGFKASQAIGLCQRYPDEFIEPVAFQQ